MFALLSPCAGVSFGLTTRMQDHNFVGDEGAFALGDALISNCSLQHLSLVRYRYIHIHMHTLFGFLLLCLMRLAQVGNPCYPHHRLHPAQRKSQSAVQQQASAPRSSLCVADRGPARTARCCVAQNMGARDQILPPSSTLRSPVAAKAQPKPISCAAPPRRVSCDSRGRRSSSRFQPAF